MLCGSMTAKMSITYVKSFNIKYNVIRNTIENIDKYSIEATSSGLRLIITDYFFHSFSTYILDASLDRIPWYLMFRSAIRMALVMLPCDLPWWPAVVKQLDRAAAARNSEDLVEAMQRLHDMCK